jgi:cobalt-zinc-cadmium resistance protein CzcA
MRHRYATVGGALLFFVLCASLFPRLGSEFIPALDEGAIEIEARFAPSISLEAAVERATALEKRLREQFPDEVDTIVSHIGRSELAFDPMLVSEWDVGISLTPQAQWKLARTKEELIAKMARAVDQLPGQAASFSQPIESRMMELIEGVGIRSDLGIKVFGPDREVLAQEGARVAQVVATVPGAVDVKTETTQGLPSLEIKIRRDEIARYGINVADVNDVVEAAVGGKAATVLTNGARRFDVVVRLAPEYRDDPEKIGRILVPAPGYPPKVGEGVPGVQVPLGQLAEIRSVEGPVQISRDNGQRRVVVQANVRGRS